MSRYFKLVLLGISCVLMLGIAGTYAKADSTVATTGSIAGTVTGPNGLTSGVSIKVFAFSGKHVQGSKTSTAGKHAKRTPVAEGTTNDNGAFTLSNVPQGNYVVIAVLKGVGRGYTLAHLTGNSVSVSIILKSHHKK